METYIRSIRLLIANPSRVGLRPLLSLGGVLTGISFNYASEAWLLVPFFLVPILYVLFRRCTSWKDAFRYSFLFGIAYLGVIFIWFWHTLPLDWLGIDNLPLAFALVFFAWGGVVTTLAFFVGIWGLSVYFLQKISAFGALFLAPFLWVFFEYLRMWGFALFTFGEESLFAPHFSVGFIGYSLSSNSILLQLALWGGVYMLSFFISFLAILFYSMFDPSLFGFGKKVRSIVFFSLAMMIGVTFFLPSEFYLRDEAQEGGREVTKVALISTTFTPTFITSREQTEEKNVTLRALLLENKEELREADVIVFPEDSRFISTLLAKGNFASLTTELGVSGDALFIDSTRIERDGEAVLKVFYATPKEGIVFEREKLFLVPNGEYFPYYFNAVLAVLGQGRTEEEFSEIRAYTKGEEVNTYGDAHHIATLFCSEILSPSLYERESALRDANLLVNISSQAWFHNSRVLYRQLQNMAKVHAVQNNQFFVQATNGALAFALDNKGMIIAESRLRGPSLVVVDIP